MSAVQQLPDEVLVESIRAGDDRSFELLYHRHVRYLAGVVYRIVGSESEVDDVIQETFVIVHQRLPDLRDAKSVRPWMTAIAVRVARRRLASQKRRQWFFALLGRNTPEPSAGRSTDGVEDIYRELDRLTPDSRVLWILRHVEGHTIDEVAALRSISPATVKRRLASVEGLMQKRLSHA